MKKQKSEMILMSQFDYNHLVNERDWYNKRMGQYRESFFKICKAFETYEGCNNNHNLENLTKIIKEEKDRY